MTRHILIAIALVLTAFCAGAETRADSLMAQLLDPGCDKVFVVAHRGDWRNAPENSLQAIANCIDMGVDMVEIDLKKTRDGHLVLMHDKTIDRTTSGKGLAQDYTLAELKAIALRNGAGHRTAHTVPTLEEAMLLAKGRILVNIDKGYDYFDEVREVLRRTGTAGQCVIKADRPYDTVRREKPAALDSMLFMPVVNLAGDEAEKTIDDYSRQLRPQLYELVFGSDGERTVALIERARRDGAKLFVNSLWPELCGGHDDDRAVERHEADESWGWIIARGARLIQTDRPAALLRYLRARGMHE